MRMRNIVAGVVVGALLPTMALASSGIFRSAFTEIGASNANGIAVGDFDDDGNQDVVTANAGLGGTDLNVFIGFGDGILSRSGLIPIDSPPSGLVLGDFDGDEVPDLMVSLANNTVAFAKGLANNDFFDAPINPVTVGQAPAGMVAIDLDGDEDLDLVVANQGGDSAPGTVSILRGNGNGTFTVVMQDDPEEPGTLIAGLPAAVGTIVVAVGNIDADPALDIVALNSNSQDKTITLYSGEGDLRFTPGGSVAVGASPQDLALVDVNDDDKLDILTADSNSDSIGVRFGNGDRTFDPATSFPVGNTPTQLRVADMNDDALLDLVVANRRSGDVSLLLGDGMGAFAVARTFVADAEPQVLALGDFNGDDRLDPVASTQGSEGAPSLALLLNRDGGTLQGVEDVLSGNVPTAVASADIDDDGVTDVVVSGNSGDVYIFPSTADGLGDPQVIEIGGRILGVLAGDLNGDTLPDLAMIDTVSSRVGVALATAAGQFGAVQLYATSTAPAGITSGDFNDDGRRDLAVSAIGPPGRASVLLQQPDGTFGPARAVAVQDTPLGIAAVETTCGGDVRHDLVVANQASNSVTVLRADAAGMFTVAQTLPEAQIGQAPQAVAVGDFDRDGTRDFVVTNSVAPGSSPSVRLFRGDCNGPYTVLKSLRGGNLVSAIVARDFTGDQLVDLGIVNQADNSVRVLQALASGEFKNNSADTVSRMPIALTAGDLNSDGRYDSISGNSDPSANNISLLINCVRDAGCDPFNTTPVTEPPGTPALRGDGNNDEHRSAADLVAVSLEVPDGDGEFVEEIAGGSFADERVSPGVDANGDGLVTPQDRRGVAHRIFDGA